MYKQKHCRLFLFFIILAPVVIQSMGSVVNNDLFLVDGAIYHLNQIKRTPRAYIMYFKSHLNFGFFFWDAKSPFNVYILIFSLNFRVMECVVLIGYT